MENSEGKNIVAVENDNIEKLDNMVQESKKETDLLDQLSVLREMTRRTGILHEAQILQLQWWPWVVIPHCKDFQIEFSHDNKILQYVIKTKGKPPTKYKKRLEYLANWVKELLGHEYDCRIVENGKVIFRK